MVRSLEAIKRAQYNYNRSVKGRERKKFYYERHHEKIINHVRENKDLIRKQLIQMHGGKCEGLGCEIVSKLKICHPFQDGWRDRLMYDQDTINRKALRGEIPVLILCEKHHNEFDYWCEKIKNLSVNDMKVKNYLMHLLPIDPEKLTNDATTPKRTMPIEKTTPNDNV